MYALVYSWGVKLVPSGNTDSLTLKAGSQYDTGSASVVSITNVKGKIIISLITFNS